MSTDKPPELTAAMNFGRRSDVFSILQAPCIPRRSSRVDGLGILIMMSYR